MTNLWAGQWHSNNGLDGDIKYNLNEDLLPKLFRSRQACREWLKEKYGYIAERPDLQEEPHGWLMPQPIKVKVIPDKPKDSK